MARRQRRRAVFSHSADAAIARRGAAALFNSHDAPGRISVRQHQHIGHRRDDASEPSPIAATVLADASHAFARSWSDFAAGVAIALW